MSLVVKDLNVRLGTAEVLKGISLSIDPGELVAIIGPNGCGKSTLLRAISGVLKPTSGSVFLNGIPLRSHKRRMRARILGLLNQVDVIPMMTTVRDHIAIGRFPYRNYLRNETEHDSMAIEQALELCQITHLADRRVEMLSGGERQRVRLATLLAQAPSKLLLDEPLTGLDLEHQYALLHLLRELNENMDRTVIVVLHDLSLAMRYFDRVLVIDDGQVVADGAPCEVMTESLIATVFRVKANIGVEPGTRNPIVVCQGKIEDDDPESAPEHD
ncbi:MAG: cobalamin/Fe(3+)-siderophore ABC transporter ATP-binding protein [Phycisphaerae bacterium]|nr:cobalamin/Fe(3+)-siderophore ABC transporter ATP-binding protein [Phycisphaerae bacterium]